MFHCLTLVFFILFKSCSDHGRNEKYCWQETIVIFQPIYMYIYINIKQLQCFRVKSQKECEDTICSTKESNFNIIFCHCLN